MRAANAGASGPEGGEPQAVYAAGVRMKSGGYATIAARRALSSATFLAAPGSGERDSSDMDKLIPCSPFMIGSMEFAADLLGRPQRRDARSCAVSMRW
jgi:hypothetical protein